MRKNRTTEKAHEVRTTAVILTQPKPLEEILKTFHDCRDCKHCFRMFAFWHCELSPETPEDEIVMFKHHLIKSCEKFTQKEK